MGSLVYLPRRGRVLLLALLLATAFACHRKEEAGPLNESTAEIPDQEGWNSQVHATKKGRPEAIVSYGHMRRFSNRKKVYFDEGVAVDFYDLNGRKRTRLDAETGEMNEANNDITANGHVVVVSDTGITLFTESLGFRQATGRIYSEVDVVLISTQGDTLYGRGFESDTQMRNWRIKQLSGASHARVDLSGDRFRKRPAFRPDSTAAAGSAPPMRKPDSTAAAGSAPPMRKPDSTAAAGNSPGERR
ncbi:MAG TPA: LPS export ABC transporter periplasmic protein LptC [bacterium]|nr:LPS export ABC transporter periplasmic protein LptC [bacterium]